MDLLRTRERKAYVVSSLGVAPELTSKRAQAENVSQADRFRKRSINQTPRYTQTVPHHSQNCNTAPQREARPLVSIGKKTIATNAARIRAPLT